MRILPDDPALLLLARTWQAESCIQAIVILGANSPAPNLALWPTMNTLKKTVTQREAVAEAAACPGPISRRSSALGRWVTAQTAAFKVASYPRSNMNPWVFPRLLTVDNPARWR